MEYLEHLLLEHLRLVRAHMRRRQVVTAVLAMINVIVVTVNATILLMTRTASWRHWIVALFNLSILVCLGSIAPLGLLDP